MRVIFSTKIKLLLSIRYAKELTIINLGDDSFSSKIDNIFVKRAVHTAYLDGAA